MIINQEVLSVIVPVYNVEKYLNRCLDSIINQSYNTLEIICVNDGSTDRSRDILEEYRKRDPRIIVLDKENGGLVSARKEGLSYAQGKYVTYVDSDDFLETDMYESLMTIMLNNKVDMVTSGLIRDYENKKIYEPEGVEAGVYSGDKLKILKKNIIDKVNFFKPNISLHVTNKIYKKELLENYQFNVPDNVSIGEDAAVILPYTFDCKSIYVSGLNLYHYCVRSDSMMGLNIQQNNDPLYKILDYFTCLKEEFCNIYGKQIEVVALYIRLLRNPIAELKYRDGFLYPYGKLDREETILLYGAGKYGVVLKQFLDSNGFKKVIWVDQNHGKKGIISLKEAKKRAFDKVIIGTLIYETQQAIIENLNEEAIPEEKVLTIRIPWTNH